MRAHPRPSLPCACGKVHVINITNHGSTPLTLAVAQSAGPACGEASPSRGDGCDTRLELAACGGGRRCLNGSILESELPSVPLTGLAMASTAGPRTVSIAPGATVVLLFARSLSSTLDAAEPLAAAVAALESAADAGAERLLEEHVAGWRTLWDEGSVEVEGDADLAAAVDASLYYILSSVRADFPYGLSPGGLASDGYARPPLVPCGYAATFGMHTRQQLPPVFGVQTLLLRATAV